VTRDLQEAARTIGLQIQILNATTIGEIDAAFAILARERPDALFVDADGFFNSRRVQIRSPEDFRAKKRGPLQAVPVMALAIADRLE
jgi:hypothetical protein